LKLGRSGDIDTNEFASAALILKLHDTFDQREQRIVLSASDIVARLPLCATLASEDIAAEHAFAAKFLKPKPLRV